MLDCLEEAGLGFQGVVGCGLSEIVAAYIDGCISLDQCYQVVSCIGRHVEETASSIGKKHTVTDSIAQCVACLTRNLSVMSLNHIKSSQCFLEQETLS